MGSFQMLAIIISKAWEIRPVYFIFSSVVMMLFVQLKKLLTAVF